MCVRCWTNLILSSWVNRTTIFPNFLLHFGQSHIWQHMGRSDILYTSFTGKAIKTQCITIQALFLYTMDMAGSEELQSGRPRSLKNPRCLNYVFEESCHWHWILPEQENKSFFCQAIKMLGLFIIANYPNYLSYLS